MIKDLYAEKNTFSCEVGPSTEHGADKWDIKAIAEAKCFCITVISDNWNKYLDVVALVKDIAIAAGMKIA